MRGDLALARSSMARRRAPACCFHARSMRWRGRLPAGHAGRRGRARDRRLCRGGGAAGDEGHACAIVACPHSETNVNAAGIAFSGYPSLLARLTEHAGGRGVPDAGRRRLAHRPCDPARAAAHALARITPELVERAARTAIEALRQLGIDSPRIGVFGINPHAGEGGLFGDDDDRIIVPAVEAAAGGRPRLSKGPLGADLMLGQRASMPSSRCITIRDTSRSSCWPAAIRRRCRSAPV